MMLGERLFNATMILLVVYAFGAVIFFFARETTLAFIKKDESDPVPEYWLILILAVPAVVVYAFVFHPVAGFVALAIVLSMLFTETNWKTEPSVRLPKTVVLSYPLQERDGSLQTRVRIDGEEWSAEFVDDGLTLPVQGDVVRIVERRGLKLILARTEQS